MRRKKAPPHEVSEAGEGHQGDRQIEKVAGLALGLAALFENAAMQKFIERTAASRRLQHAFQRVQPDWRL